MGIYIYGWPIQQITAQVLGPDVNWWNNFLLSMPLILLMAMFSWHVVEKQTMALKTLNLSQVRIKLNG